jgi:hypothetical protein
MKTLSKKALSFLLSVLMLTTMMVAGGYSVIAATTDDASVGTTAKSGDTIYFKNTDNWSNVYCYMWVKDTKTENKSWPGEAMTDEGDGIWSYTIKDEYDMVIFNNNSGTQTGDLDYPGDGMIRNGVNGSFEKYDTSPLKISSFSSDLSSPQYVGSVVTFTTNATSAGATVEYQYSINNSVVQAYSSNNTVSWAPTSAGSYTIRVDVKDSAGNENSRETSFEIKDPTSETKPVYLSASPANKTQILANTTTNIKINAAGGNTGTKLLFYKYVVKDALGTQENTAYYTLNNTFSFTPKSNGTYTVAVSIQGSDNQTVTQELKYDVVGGLDPTKPTNPTVTTPSQTATTPTATTPTATQGTTPESGLLGDVNNDGQLNVKDATAIQRKLVNSYKGTYIAARADYNKDGVVDVNDATTIQKKISNLI